MTWGRKVRDEPCHLIPRMVMILFSSSELANVQVYASVPKTDAVGLADLFGRVHVRKKASRHGMAVGIATLHLTRHRSLDGNCGVQSLRAAMLPRTKFQRLGASYAHPVSPLGFSNRGEKYHPRCS